MKHLQWVSRRIRIVHPGHARERRSGYTEWCAIASRETTLELRVVHDDYSEDFWEALAALSVGMYAEEEGVDASSLKVFWVGEMEEGQDSVWFSRLD